MNRLEKIALATASTATLLGLFGSQSFAYTYYFDQMLPGSLSVGLLGWAIATYGPLILAVTFWRLSVRFRRPVNLMLHLLFLLCALAVFRAGQAIMLALISDPDFDATLGGPELPALLSLAVAIISYFAAAIRQRTPSTGPSGG